VKVKKKLVVVLSLTAAMVPGVAATLLPAQQPGVLYKNLKVLPKNISSRDLNGIMVDDFQDALGVTCDFCHAQAPGAHGLDFVSDAKPEKEIARAMMRMELGLNKKYFKVKHPLIGGDMLVVTCNTCHKGEAFPDEGAETK
jgi:hypothetical protein